jgi:hypothetical protein
MAEDIEIAGVKKLIIHFKEEGNVVKLDKVQKQENGPPQDIQPQPGDPGGYLIGTLVTYTKNPNCIGFVIGGSYYEICF